LQEDRAQLHLDPPFGQGGQGAVDQQALVEQAGGRLDNVGLEAFHHPERIVGGEDRDPDIFKQALVAQLQEPRPKRRTVRSEKVAGRLDDDGVGALQPQASQRGPGLGLDMVGTPVGAAGLQHHAKAARPWQLLADHVVGIGRAARGVEHG